MKQSVPPSKPPARAEAASHIATFVTELAQMARRNELDTLGYLLEMARLEAENLMRKAADRHPGGHDPGRH